MVSAAVDTLETGSLFANDFVIVRPLSAGGMGSVYVARQRSTGKERALKLMLAQLVASADLRRRFHQEARIAALVKSDHVVEVVGAGVDEASGTPWLAMELLEGMDLDRAVTRRGPMTLVETRRVMKELCHAVSAAHDAGIIHRDLKPENIFLAASNYAAGAEIVKVLDFGIAKISVEAASKHTGAMGSPIWMAPEQTERSAITFAADVWALGLIAFFTLTGKPFWLSASDNEGSVQQIMRETLFEPIPPASKRALQFGAADLLPPWFDDWFARCVVRDPALRLQTASEAFALFSDLCDGRTSSGIPAPSSSSRVVVSSNFRSAADLSGTGPTVLGRSEEPGASAFASRADKKRSTVRPVFVIAGLLSLTMLAVAAYRGLFREPAPVTRELPRITARSVSLPPELASTRGAEWFTAVRSQCNPIEVELLLKQQPPPRGKDGAGFAAACFVLAGRIDHARAALRGVAAGDRAWASWAVFEVAHPIADAGNDVAAAPAMRLVLEFWPDNYMALYHAGIAEYRTNHPAWTREHLEKFLRLYQKHDGFTATAERVLADVARGTANPDCSAPLITDPEGRKVYALGCNAK